MGYRDYSTAKGRIVDATGHGDFTTIQAAITASSSGQTVFIRPGIYTENLTLKVGVTLCAYPAFGAFGSAFSGNVIINGTCTLTTAGTATIYGCTLQTNGAAAVVVSGSAASVLIIENCYLNCTDATGVTLSSSSSSSSIIFSYCTGNITTTGIALFAHSGAGQLRFLHSAFNNGGGSTTANTVSGGGFFGPNYSGWANGLSLSGASSSVGDFLDMTMAGNQTAITTADTSGFNFQHSTIASNTSSCISLGAGTSGQLHHCLLSSSNGNTIAGSGTLAFTNITFNSVANLQNTLTLSNGAMNGFFTGAGVGTAGQVLTSNGSSSPPTWQAAGGGALVKQVRASTNTAGSTATAMPFDDTIPQIGEGAEILNVAITPANASNILLIEYNYYASMSAPDGAAINMTSALFQDATANAIYAQCDINRFSGDTSGAKNWARSISGRFYMVAGTTSSTTFRLRAGTSSGTYYWLSNVGSGLYSTADLATLTVTEFTP